MVIIRAIATENYFSFAPGVRKNQKIMIVAILAMLCEYKVVKQGSYYTVTGMSDVKLDEKENDIYVLETALKKLSLAFDEFISECLDGAKQKAPDYRAIMKARGYLPPYCKNAYAKKGL